MRDELRKGRNAWGVIFGMLAFFALLVVFSQVPAIARTLKSEHWYWPTIAILVISAIVGFIAHGWRDARLMKEIAAYDDEEVRFHYASYREKKLRSDVIFYIAIALVLAWFLFKPRETEPGGKADAGTRDEAATEEGPSPPPAAPPAAAAVPATAPNPATAADAGLRICNRSSERGVLALGYLDGGTWVSDGWRQLERDDCLTVATGIAGNRYYYYAMGERGGAWGGDYVLCVDPQSAFRVEGVAECEARGYVSKGFGMLEFAAGASEYSLSLTGGKPDPLDELEVDDGVYVQGWLSDEMSIVMRVDKANRRVKVRRSEDLTTTWVDADRIITREQANMNDIGRGALVLTAGFCLFYPDKCRDQGQAATP